jgi:hypothetical protein
LQRGTWFMELEYQILLYSVARKFQYSEFEILLSD